MLRVLSVMEFIVIAGACCFWQWNGNLGIVSIQMLGDGLKDLRISIYYNIYVYIFIDFFFSRTTVGLRRATCKLSGNVLRSLVNKRPCSAARGFSEAPSFHHSSSSCGQMIPVK